MPNVFADAVTWIDRWIPASESRRRELRLMRSQGDRTQRPPDPAWIREAEMIAARAWLADSPSWIREAEAAAAQEWLSDARFV